MTISPEEARRLANEVLDEPEQKKPPVSGPIGPGSTIGRYSIERLIAIGGMGAVYRAAREHPTRIVALKLVRPELLSSSAVRRFQHETELLGRLQHPGIAQIFEADSVRTDLGDQPYFAMEFVEGKPLLDYADEAELRTRDRLELFLKVCDAVEHAHRKGVIHRDLKPGNVLVTGEGEPKILDFGVAKATDADIQSTTLRTNVGQLVGTLPYMSPEQAGGDAADLDTRSDVYSLGVLLYHLLSGRLPYEIRKTAIPESLRAIQEEDPAPLSGIDKTLRGDIETIVGKALEKDRDRRYQGASELAGDIRRYLASEPITARPASAWYQVKRFANRNKRFVSTVAVLALFLLVGFATSILLAVRMSIAMEDTRDHAMSADALVSFMQEMIISASPEVSLGRDLSIAEAIDLAAESSERAEGWTDKTEASFRFALGKLNKRLRRYEEAERELVIASDIRTREFGRDHLRTLEVRLDLAVVQFKLAREEESLQEVQEVLRFRRARLGDRDSATIRTVVTLATLISDRGGSQSELRALVAELASVLPAYKPTTRREMVELLANTSSLAGIMVQTREFDEAKALIESVEARRIEYLGELHPMTINSYVLLAMIEKETGDEDLAVTQMRNAVELSVRAFGSGSAKALTDQYSLAGLLYELKRPAEALEVAESILDGVLEQFPAGHPRIQALYVLLGKINHSQKEIEKANRWIRLAMEEAEKDPAQGGLYSALTQRILGEMLMLEGQYEDAELELLESHAKIVEVLGDDSARAVMGLETIIDLYQRWEKPEKTDIYQQKLERVRLNQGGG